MDSLNFVKLKNNLLHLDLEKQLVETIEKRIRNLPNFQELRLNPELILLVCNLIENAQTNNKRKIDKKPLVIRVLHTIFTYSEADKKHIDQTIEFLYANGKIKKVSSFRRFFAVVLDWVSRKFL